MAEVTLFTETEIREALKSLPDWEYDGQALTRTVKLASFLRGIELVNAVAHLAERQDHHPDIDIRYWTVTFRYWTHTAGGVTLLDVAGAKEVDGLIAHFKKEPAPVTG